MDGGKGNYGCWGLCDFMAGTSVGEGLAEDVRAEAEEKDGVRKRKGGRRAAGKRKK